MRFKHALSGLRHLSETILSDGKVDVDEARQLQEFIYPYVLSGNEVFVEFNKLLDAYLKDGQITKEESDNIAKSIHDIIGFLKLDNWACIAALSLFFGMIVIMFTACLLS